MCEWGIGVTCPNLHFFNIYRQSGIRALYWVTHSILGLIYALFSGTYILLGQTYSDRVNYLTFYMSGYLTFRHKQFVNSSFSNTFFHFCDECVALEQESIFTWFGFLFSEHLIPRMWGAGRLIEFLESLERNRSDSLSWDKSPPPPFIWFISRHNRLARNHLAPTNTPNKAFWYKVLLPTGCSKVCRKK